MPETNKPDTLRALLFDLDDTLIVYDKACEEAWSATCSRFHAEAGFTSSGDLFRSIDAARSWYWSDAKRHRKGRLNLREGRRDVVRLALEQASRRNEETACRIADFYTDLQDSLIRPFPDAFPVLDALKQRGIRLGMLTNGASDKQNAKIDRFGFRPYFEFYLVEGDLGYGKPDLRVFRKALSLLGLPAKETAMTGDNPAWDIAPALQLGMTAYWMDRGNHTLPDGLRPHRILRTLSELPV